jgi:hypothetical protein
VTYSEAELKAHNTMKIALSLLEIVKSEHDQIEFAQLNGEAVYSYEDQDLQFFAEEGVLSNPDSRGRRYFRIAVFERLDSEDSMANIWSPVDP